VSLTPADLQMDDDMAPDAHAQSSDDEDIENAHIPKVNLCVKDSILRHNVSKQLPLGGPPSQVIIQSDFFFNKDLEYLRYGSKGSRPALLISKMKATYYLDVGLEKMVPDQMWIKEECKHTSEGVRRAVRTHMRILSVVRIKVFSMYVYDYRRRSSFVERILTSTLFRNETSKDFQLEIESYQTQLNLTKPRWNATSFEYKHEYMVIDSPIAVTFQDRYGVQMIMRFHEIHKFRDDTLYQVNEAMDYRVKEFKPPPPPPPAGPSGALGSPGASGFSQVPPPPLPPLSTNQEDSMLMKRIGELKHIMENLIQDNKHLKERLDSHGTRLYTLEDLDIPQQVSKAVDEIITDAVDWAIQPPLWNHFRHLPEVDMKEILHQRMWETNSYKTH
nr:hypothetical protein [Tanacetum cinerariifolium]